MRSSVHDPLTSCPGCPFRGPRVGSKGDIESPIVFVAESPGKEEVRAGEPLIGPSGKIFHQFVPDDGSVLIMNALECSPLTALKSEKSLNEAVGCCQGHLLDKIRMHPRRIIVAMGNAALRSLTGDLNLKITQVRGRLIPSALSELGILPVVHIAALMRGGGNWNQWKNDMINAMDWGLGAAPPKYIQATKVPIPEDATQEYVDGVMREMVHGTNELSADIETSGLSFLKHRVIMTGITPADDPTTGYVFMPNQLHMLKPWLEDKDISWAWHNGKFDVKFFHQIGINARVNDDTMLLSYCLDESGGVHGLEQVAADLLSAPDYKYKLKPYLPNKDSSYELVPTDVLSTYQADDSARTAQVRTILRRRVAAQEDLERLYTETLVPASAMLTQVEENGIQVDPKRLDENEKFFEEMKWEVAAEIRQLTGFNINPGSPKQVKKLLFHHYRFPNRAKGSTREEVLKKLQKQTEHPIFEMILKHRKAVKMSGTYVKGIRRWVQPDGRVHPTFLLHGTRTGRLAAREPNSQNPPRISQIRGTFIAAPEHELLEIDLSQAELRVIACLSRDEKLIDIYQNDGDIHDSTAMEIFPGWHAERKGAKEQRVKAKNVNFGIPYGISKFGLQGQIGGMIEEAQRMLDAWASAYPEAHQFLQACRNTPLRGQVITTCFGRKKRVGLVTAANLNFLQNEAANFPSQSIASDITLHTAIRTWEQLLEWGVRIVNLVHDSLILEVPITPGDVVRNKAIKLVRHEFAQVPIDYGIDEVPFKTDAEVGHRWGSLIDVRKLAA